jgi:anti-sigma B factor antagonist
MDLHGSVEIVGAVPVLSLTGSVDLATVAELRDLVLRAVVDHPGRCVVVDLDSISSLDDAGLGVLLGAAGRARQVGGDVALICADERLRDRFRMTRLDQAIEVGTSLTDLFSSR